jgi:hypothetical protein
MALSPESQRIINELRAAKSWPKSDAKRMAKVQEESRLKDIKRIKTRVSPLKSGGLAGPIGMGGGFPNELNK